MALITGAYRGDLLGQIDVLGQLHLALLERARQVCLLNGLAQVGLLVDKRDEAVFDLEMHLRALFDTLFEVARSFDREGRSSTLAGQQSGPKQRQAARLRCGASPSASSIDRGWDKRTARGDSG